MHVAQSAQMSESVVVTVAMGSTFCLNRYELDSVDFALDKAGMLCRCGLGAAWGPMRRWRRTLANAGSTAPPEGCRPEGTTALALIHHQPGRSAVRARGACPCGGCYRDFTSVVCAGRFVFRRTFKAARSSASA